MCCDALVAGHCRQSRFPPQITSLAVPYTHLRSLLCVALLEFPWTPLLMSELAGVLLGQLGVSLAHWVDLEGVFQVILVSCEMYLFERENVINLGEKY